MTWTRRRAIRNFASLLAASPVLRGQESIAPREELVNVFEAEDAARRALPDAAHALIAGSNRRAFERMTLRPRMLVNITQLDLSTELFGEKLFTPILMGPISEQKRFHSEGELASVRGASAAQTVMVVSGRSSFPVTEIAAQSKTTLWYQVYPEPDMTAVRDRVMAALRSGCKAVCLTVGTPSGAVGWNAIDRLRQGLKVPFVLKGILSAEEARTAVQHGVEGIVVSNHGGTFATGLAEPIEALPAIVDAVGGKAPVLVDGSFRRGTDILKALALGARAVLIGRPAMWGLAAYGAGGVETVLQMLQSELARDMGMSGKPNVKAIDRSLVRIHRR
ncbi:MAG: alpha-hydroxy-acid oxidizing protein [Bryobacteraceae bacterium]